MTSTAVRSFLDRLAREVILERDPRTAEWVLPGNKAFLLVLFTVYVYVVKIGGPRFMNDRKPYDGIKPVVIVYNACMVVLNTYFMAAFLSRTYMGGGYSLTCQGINYEARDEKTMSMLNLLWWYLLVRIADFMDTVFFVLRKKDSHVSFLHVVHHMLVVYNGCYGLGYGPDGQIALSIGQIALSRACGHVHLLLAPLLRPAVQKHLWGKRYLTQLQLVQFSCVFMHMMVPMFVNCGYPRVHIYIMLCEAVFFFIMFARFYRQAYKDRKAPAKQHVDSDALKSKVQ